MEIKTAPRSAIHTITWKTYEASKSELCVMLGIPSLTNDEVELELGGDGLIITVKSDRI